LGILRGTVVVVQHATDPLTTPNASLAFGSLERLNQLVTDALMIPLRMVVGDELGNRVSKMSLPEQDDALEALLVWYRMLAGFPRCLGVTGPKRGPKFRVVVEP
jgi:hypothetical protein